MVAHMFSRVLSKDCNHSKAGVCSKCILQETFNLDSTLPTLSVQIPSASHVINHAETPTSESMPNLEVTTNDFAECSIADEEGLPVPSSEDDQKDRMEVEFVNSLISIGNKLKMGQSREVRCALLISELFQLNLKLPARVWLPLYSDSNAHLVVQIPFTEACVLNSKDKVPYCIYCEVIEVENVDTANLPEKNIEEQIEQIKLIKSITTASTSHNLTVPTSSRLANGSVKENVKGEVRSDLTTCRSEPVLNVYDVREYDTICFDQIIDETRSVIDSDEIYSQLSDELEFNNKPMSKFSKVRQSLAKLKIRRKPGLKPAVDDPSAAIMSEPWEEKQRRIKATSPYGSLPGWKLLPVIVKTGDDLRQELLAYQLLSTLQEIWQIEGIPLYLRPYKIVVCSHNSGMIEPIVNACSLHQIKKNLLFNPSFDDANQTYPPTLLSHFLIHYGSRLSESFQHAQQNFIRSCAAYSLACYYLQVKDRHNGNILLDSEGHLIHIDFGYIFTISPRNLGFETSPFKLTSELVDVMGGLNSESFAGFRELLFNGMLAVRKNYKKIMTLVDVRSNNSLPCFRGGNNAAKLLFDRFHVGCSEDELRNVANGLVDQSRDSLTTRLYDNFQYFTNGIF